MSSSQSLSIFLPPDPQTGKGVILTTTIDTDNPLDAERAAQLKAVAATNPSSIAEFFIRLNEYIKAKP